MNLSQEYCITYGSDISTFLPYRMCYLFHFTSEMLGIYFLSNLLFHHMKTIPVHRNLKVVMWLYYLNMMLFCVSTGVGQIKFVYNSFTFDDPCELFISSLEYKIGHIVTTFAICNQLWVQMVLWIERLTSSLNPSTYERRGMQLGIILLIFSHLFSTLSSVYIHWDSTFENPVINFQTTAPSADGRINNMYGLSIIVSLGGLAALFLIRRHNTRQKERFRFCLSSRYQISENIRSTHFIWAISFLTTVVYMLYGTTTLTIRLLTANFPDIRVVTTVRSAVYMLPQLCLASPLYAIHLLRQQRKEMSSRVRNVASNLRGDAATAAYSDILNRQWNP